MSADVQPALYGEVEDYSVNIVEASETKPSYHTNKFNSFGHYNIINKFIVECSTDDEAVTGYKHTMAQKYGCC
jgi:hypothetical protein